MNQIYMKDAQAYCETMHAKGHSLSMEWDGGNDSGMFKFKVDDLPIEDLQPVEQYLLDLLETRLDYGSFAGNYATSGEIIYDPDEMCFRGEDCYQTSEDGTAKCDILITLPFKLWFDALEVRIEALDSDEIKIDLQLRINNGPHPMDFEDESKRLIRYLEESVSSVVARIADFEQITDEIVIRRDDFTCKKDSFYYHIKSLPYTYVYESIEDICIDLNAEE